MRPNPILAAFLIGALTCSTIANAAPKAKPKRALTAARPALNTEAIAKDLLVSCIAEAKAQINYLTTKQQNKAPLDFAKFLVMRDALSQASVKKAALAWPPLADIRFAANEQIKAGGDQSQVYSACMIGRLIDIHAGSPLRTAPPPRSLDATHSPPPTPGGASVGLASLQGTAAPMATCEARAATADLAGRATRLRDNPPKNPSEGRRATIALIDETIEILRPCLGQPEAAKSIQSALQMREQLVGQCRALAMLADCLAPRAR